MQKGMKIVTCILASIGLACAVKYIMDHKKCCCGWHKIKVEDEKPAETTPHKTKEEEKTTGSRYGSNPAKY